MDSLMVVEQYVTPSMVRRSVRENSSFLKDGFMSPTSCHAFEDEYTPLRGSTSSSVPVSPHSPAPWNAAAAFNKALNSLKASKPFIRFSSTSKGDMPLVSPGPPAAPLPQTTTEGDASPQRMTNVLANNVSTPFSDDCCTPSSASCNRRSGASRRSFGDDDVQGVSYTTSPPEHSRDRPTSTSNSTPSVSPFQSAALAPSTPRNPKPRGAKSALRLLASTASSPLSCHVPLSARSSTTFFGAPSPSYPVTPIKAKVSQTAAASAALVRKAISAPLERVGVLSTCKEKLE